MKFFKNSYNFLASFYLIFSLFSVFILIKVWLPPHYVVAGHDSGLPLDAETFLKSRFFSWDDRLSFGSDNSLNFGSLTIHSFDYLLAKIAGVSYAGNYLSFWFWISLVFTSAFIFAFSLRQKLGNFFPFFFPILITFNFLVFQSLFMLERAKYGLLTSTLILLTFLFKVIEKKTSIFVSAAITSVVFSIFNGGSLFGLPLYGSPLLIVFTILGFYLIRGMINRDFKIFFRILAFLGLTSFLFLILNSYAIFPYLPTILNKDFSLGLTSRAILNNKEWVDYISQASSFLNLFRLQGIPSWYLFPYTIDLNHPYAPLYETNKILILLSLFFPIVALFSIFLAKRGQRLIIILFLTIAFISMFFSAGTHKPLGFLYGILFDYLPGFNIFRTPFYKFGTALFISFAFLISLSFCILIERTSLLLRDKMSLLVSNNLSSRLIPLLRFNSIMVQPFIFIFFTLLWFGYHYVLFSPFNVFYWSRDLTTRIDVPNYVWEFKNWSDRVENKEGKFLLVPPINKSNFADRYTWGYWSLSPLHQMLVAVPTISNELNLTKEQSDWLQAMYSAIEKNDEGLVANLADRLGIQFILLREDVEDSQAADRYRENLDSLSYIKRDKEFGKWIVYKIDKEGSKLIKPINTITLVPPGNTYLAREFAENDNVIFYDQTNSTSGLDGFVSQKISVHTCLSCLIETREENLDLPSVRILPTVPIYFLKEKREKMILEEESDTSDKILAYLGSVLRRVSEVRSMLFLEAKENDIRPTIQKTTLYLQEAKKLIVNYSDPTSDYAFARQVLDLITPVQMKLREYAGSGEFSSREESIRSGIHEILLLVNQIEKFYSPILSDPQDLANNKVFIIEDSDKFDKEWYINPLTLPSSLNGDILLPDLVKFQDSEKILKLEKQTNGWIKIEGMANEFGKEPKLIMNFSAPNLFIDRGLSINQFPTGPRNCTGIKIATFSSGKAYQINVQPLDRTQILRIVARDENFPVYDGFFKADNEARIFPVEVSKPFRYIYKSSSQTKDPTVYVCSSDMDPPDIGMIKIHEIFSPTLVSVSKNNTTDRKIPTISFNKISPAEYSISGKDGSEPFVLLFNQPYSPLWKLYKQPEVKPLNSDLLYILFNWTKDEKKHFLIDGYANGWVVDPSSGQNWILIYIPQILFYLGLSVSVISFLSLAIYIFKRNFKI